MMYGNWSAWMMIMPLVWIGLIALIVWAVIRLTHGPVEHRHAPPPAIHPHRESATEVLDRRFASGELDEDTYLRMRDRLEGRGGAGP